MYSVIIRIFSIWNRKARLFIAGRENLFSKLEEDNIKNQDDVVWVHCASLGEFEQARPLIDILSKTNKILLTFFSPSGYEIRKEYTAADWVYYLPLDNEVDSKRFIELVQPKAVYFTKYEIWYHYLNELKKANIRTYLFSAKFRKNHIYFKSWIKFFGNMLKCFTHIFVQDDNSQKLLASINIENVTVAGDTRVDRVCDLADSVKELPNIKSFKGEKELIVLGSVWEEDMEIWIKFIIAHSELKFVVVPHEIDQEEIEIWMNRLKMESMLLSEFHEDKAYINVLFVDTIGLLSSIYQYADVSYIGGGFGKGIHNTLEAAVFGAPVIFGPRYKRFGEAVALKKLGGGITIRNRKQLQSVWKELSDLNLRKQKGDVAKTFVRQSKGVVNKILKVVNEG